MSVSDPKNARIEDLSTFIEMVERIKNNDPKLDMNSHRRVTRDIQRLESWLGLDKSNPLIEFSKGKNNKVTDVGEKFAKEAAQLLVSLDKWKRYLNRRSRGVRIRIGYRKLHWDWLVKKLYLDTLKKAGGNLSIELYSAGADTLWDMLSRRELDICLLYEGHPTPYGYSEHQLTTQDLYLLVHLPENISEKPSLEDLTQSGNYKYISVHRSTLSYNSQHADHHGNIPFFNFPFHSFSDVDHAWDYFTHEQGSGSVGYFSRRKFERVKDNPRFIRQGISKISRNLTLFTRDIDTSASDESFAAEIQSNVWAHIANDEQPSATPLTMSTLIEEISNQLKENVAANNRAHINGGNV